MGEVDYMGEDGSIVFRRSEVIRKWGTSNGLGELSNGKLPNTISDRNADGVRVPGTSVIYIMPIRQWSFR